MKNHEETSSKALVPNSFLLLLVRHLLLLAMHLFLVASCQELQERIDAKILPVRKVDTLSAPFKPKTKRKWQQEKKVIAKKRLRAWKGITGEAIVHLK